MRLHFPLQPLVVILLSSILLLGDALDLRESELVSQLRSKLQVRSFLGQVLRRESPLNEMPQRYSDEHLDRWIKAANNDVEAANQNVRRSNLWMRYFDPNGDLLTWKSSTPLVKALLPYEQTGYAQDGSPVFYVPLGRWEIQRLIEAGGFRESQRYIIQLFERALQSTFGQKNPLDPAGKEGVSKAIFLLDLKGLSRSQILSPRALYLLMSAINIVDANYPLLVKRYFFINAPLGTSFFLEALRSSRVQSSSTIDSFKVYRSEREWLPALYASIPKSVIPVNLGGSKILRI